MVHMMSNYSVTERFIYRLDRFKTKQRDKAQSYWNKERSYLSN